MLKKHVSFLITWETKHSLKVFCAAVACWDFTTLSSMERWLIFNQLICIIMSNLSNLSALLMQDLPPDTLIVNIHFASWCHYEQPQMIVLLWFVICLTVMSVITCLQSIQSCFSLILHILSSVRFHSLVELKSVSITNSIGLNLHLTTFTIVPCSFDKLVHDCTKHKGITLSLCLILVHHSIEGVGVWNVVWRKMTAVCFCSSTPPSGWLLPSADRIISDKHCDRLTLYVTRTHVSALSVRLQLMFYSFNLSFCNVVE